MHAPTDAAAGAIPIDPDLLPPTPDPEPSATPRKKRIRPIHQAARNSIYDLMYQQAGTSLFVRPLFWTDQHCHLLGVRFQELPPCDTPVPEEAAGTPPSRGHMRPSRAITTLSDALTEILLSSSQSHTLTSSAVRLVLGTLWPDAFSRVRLSSALCMFFGGRVYRDVVRVEVMWNFSSHVMESYESFHSVSTRPAESFGLTSVSSSPVHNPINLPMVSYISKSQLVAMRRNVFRVGRGPKNSLNEPVWRLQRLRSKMLNPSNDDHDPHLAGIFLAMAQRHFYGLPSPSTRNGQVWEPRETTLNPTFHNLTLRILTHDNDTAEFIIYTATVTAAFLQRFHDPFNTPEDESGNVPGMDIQLTRVPIWPILGLRERMGKALGQEIVGPFNQDEIERWEDDGDDGDDTPTMSGKRKRKALSEVLNGSFEDDTNDDEADGPTLTAKKRRLREGSAVGLVV